MNFKKLNARGFTHDFLIVAVVFFIAVLGTGYKVATHAAPSNPNNCPSPFIKNAAPAANHLTPVLQYFNNSINGVSYKDHFYTLMRNDTALASLGWCYEPANVGYAYSNNVPGTVPLYQYYSGTIHKHFYTRQPNSVEPQSCCGYLNEGPIAYISPEHVAGTEPLFRFFNPNTLGHVFTVKTSDFAPLMNNYGYTHNEGIAGYVWISAAPVSSAPPNSSGTSGSTPTPTPTPTPTAPKPRPMPMPAKPAPKPVTPSTSATMPPSSMPGTSSSGSSMTSMLGSSGGTNSPPDGSTPHSGGCNNVIEGYKGECGGFFVIHCDYDHSAKVDPIMFFGKTNARDMHMHEFFGAKGVVANSSASGLLNHPTTCHNPNDTAAYWSPAAYMNNTRIIDSYQNEYWFDGGFQKTEKIPFGFEMIAGDHMATSDQPVSHVYYYCGAQLHSTTAQANMHTKPYTCGGGAIIMVIRFPQCWDGVQVPAGHGMEQMSHMKYPASPGNCPKGFNHVFPRLEEHVHFGIPGPYDSHHNFALRLSSGPYYTLHGDFINSWHEAVLKKFVTNCINAHQTCHRVPVAGS